MSSRRGIAVGFGCAWAHCSAAPNKKAQPFRAGLSSVGVDVQERVAIRSCSLQKLAQRPYLPGDPRLHRGCDAQLHMHAAEVVPSEVETIRGPEVLPLLTEGIGQSREAAHLHSDGEVLALHVRR